MPTCRYRLRAGRLEQFDEESGRWVPYAGPRGGKGAEHTATGRKRYGKEAEKALAAQARRDGPGRKQQHQEPPGSDRVEQAHASSLALTQRLASGAATFPELVQHVNHLHTTLSTAELGTVARRLGHAAPIKGRDDALKAIHAQLRAHRQNKDLRFGDQVQKFAAAPPAAPDINPPELAVVDGDGAGVEIFEAGTYRGQDYTPEQLQGVEANFQKLCQGDSPLFRPTVVIGHEEAQEWLKNTGIPAAGVVSKLWRDGTKLKAFFADVPPQVAQAINARAYRTVSAEFYENFEYGGQQYGLTLRRVALLGGELPEVKTLAELPQAHFQDQPQKTFWVSFACAQHKVAAGPVQKFRIKQVVRTERGKLKGITDRGRSVYGKELERQLARTHEKSASQRDRARAQAAKQPGFRPAARTQVKAPARDELNQQDVERTERQGKRATRKQAQAIGRAAQSATARAQNRLAGRMRRLDAIAANQAQPRKAAPKTQLAPATATPVATPVVPAQAAPQGIRPSEPPTHREWGIAIARKVDPVLKKAVGWLTGKAVQAGKAGVRVGVGTARATLPRVARAGAAAGVGLAGAAGVGGLAIGGTGLRAAGTALRHARTAGAWLGRTLDDTVGEWATGVAGNLSGDGPKVVRGTRQLLRGAGQVAGWVADKAAAGLDAGGAAVQRASKKLAQKTLDAIARIYGRKKFAEGRVSCFAATWTAFRTERGTTGAYNPATQEKVYGKKARALLDGGRPRKETYQKRTDADVAPRAKRQGPDAAVAKIDRLSKEALGLAPERIRDPQVRKLDQASQEALGLAPESPAKDPQVRKLQKALSGLGQEDWGQTPPHVRKALEALQAEPNVPLAAEARAVTTGDVVGHVRRLAGSIGAKLRGAASKSKDWVLGLPVIREIADGIRAEWALVHEGEAPATKKGKLAAILKGAAKGGGKAGLPVLRDVHGQLEKAKAKGKGGKAAVAKGVGIGALKYVTDLFADIGVDIYKDVRAKHGRAAGVAAAGTYYLLNWLGAASILIPGLTAGKKFITGSIASYIVGPLVGVTVRGAGKVLDKVAAATADHARTVPPTRFAEEPPLTLGAIAGAVQDIHRKLQQAGLATGPLPQALVLWAIDKVLGSDGASSGVEQFAIKRHFTTTTGQPAGITDTGRKVYGKKYQQMLKAEQAQKGQPTAEPARQPAATADHAAAVKGLYDQAARTPTQELPGKIDALLAPLAKLPQPDLVRIAAEGVGMTAGTARMSRPKLLQAIRDRIVRRKGMAARAEMTDPAPWKEFVARARGEKKAGR